MEARSLVDSGAEAMPLLEDAVARARASGDPALEADALEQWGHGFVRAGNFAEATARYRRQMEAAQAIGDSRRVAEAGYYLGEALLGSGQVAAARDQLEASIREFSRHGATRSEARAMADLATAYAMLGRRADANATFEQSLARCRSIGFLEGEALALGNYSKTVILEGRLDRAGELMENWRECNQVLRSPFFDAYWLLHSGDYYWARQDLDQARVFYTEAVSAFRKLGAVYGEADALVSLARVHAAANAPKDSARRAREAQDLVEANGLAEPDPLPRAYLARAGRIPASEVTVPEARQAPVRAEAHLVLHEAGAAGPHLESALEILEAMSSHLTGEDARLFWIHNPVARRARAAETGGAA